MGADPWLGDVLLVCLPEGPIEGSREVSLVCGEARRGAVNRDVVIDLSKVRKLRPVIVSAIIPLRGALMRRELNLILTGVTPALMEGFRIGGLDKKLCFAEDKKALPANKQAAA